MKISRFRRAVPGANHVTFGRRPSRRLLLSASALAIGLALAGTGLSAPVLAAGTSTGARPVPASARFRSACPNAPVGYFRCFALFRPQTSVNRAITEGIPGRASKPVGLTPREIEQAYRLPVGRHSHQTVAIS